MMVPNDGRAKSYENEQGRRRIEQAVFFGEGFIDHILGHYVKRGSEKKHLRAQRHDAGLHDLNPEEWVEEAQERIKRSIVKVRIGDLGQQDSVVEIIVIWRDAINGNR